jgi:hypothetical protein
MEIPHFQVPKPKDLSSLLGGLALVMGTSTVVSLVLTFSQTILGSTLQKKKIWLEKGHVWGLLYV